MWSVCSFTVLTLPGPQPLNFYLYKMILIHQSYRCFSFTLKQGGFLLQTFFVLARGAQPYRHSLSLTRHAMLSLHLYGNADCAIHTKYCQKNVFSENHNILLCLFYCLYGSLLLGSDPKIFVFNLRAATVFFILSLIPLIFIIL